MLAVVLFWRYTIPTKPAHTTMRTYVRTLGTDRAATGASRLVSLPWAPILRSLGTFWPRSPAHLSNGKHTGTPGTVGAHLGPRAGAGAPWGPPPSIGGRGSGSPQSFWHGGMGSAMTWDVHHFIFSESRERGRVTRRHRVLGRSHALGSHGRQTS